MKLNIGKNNIYSFFVHERENFSFSDKEYSAIRYFSPKRLSDFSSGRYCAMKALEQVAINNAIIPIGNDREPIWPVGIVGSISHCDILTGAIVAKSNDYYSLGLDIEEIGRVTTDLWDIIFTEKEQQYLSCLSDKEKRIQSTAIFSIKEAFYKFQFPVTKLFLDFLDVEMDCPSLSRVVVLSELVIKNSPIRNNNSSYFIEKGCVVAFVF